MSEIPDSSSPDEVPETSAEEELGQDTAVDEGGDCSLASVDAAAECESGDDEGRRNFVWQLVAATAGGIVALGPLCVGLYTFLTNPFKRPRPPHNFDSGGAAGAASEYRIAPLSALPADGVPRRFAVIADKTDGWNFTPDQPIGAVYLARQPAGDGETESISALHATCPHAGCTVSYSVDMDAFLCPCHNSSFGKDGSKKDLAGRTNPSPRSLDQLSVNQAKLDEDGEIWIEFANYYTGRAEKIAKK